MTERLTALLRDQAGGVDVPPPSPDLILARGRREHRKRQGALAAGVVAVVAVVGGGSLAVAGVFGDDGRADVAGVPEEMVGPVFSVDTTLYYGPQLRTAEVPDKAVKSLLYTSAGVLVRHGDDPFSDGGGPQRFSLVRADGTVDRLGLVTEGTVHASDPDQPYVAYGEAVDGELQVVVYDVVADEEAARVPVTDTGDSWFPVAFDGGHVFVQAGYDGGVHVVDWRSGDATESEDLSSVWSVNGGRVADYVDDVPVVRDAATGEVLLTGPAVGFFEVSPDGRFAGLVDEEGPEGETVSEYVVYDVATGDSVTLEGNAFEWGWTPDGDVFQLGEDSVTTCDTGTGECTRTAVDLPDGVGSDGGFAQAQTCSMEEGAEKMVCEEPDGPVLPEVRLGGRAYES